MLSQDNFVCLSNWIYKWQLYFLPVKKSTDNYQLGLYDIILE